MGGPGKGGGVRIPGKKRPRKLSGPFAVRTTKAPWGINGNTRGRRGAELRIRFNAQGFYKRFLLDLIAHDLLKGGPGKREEKKKKKKHVSSLEGQHDQGRKNGAVHRGLAKS